MTVDATDVGSGDGTTPSGVRSVEVLVDGARRTLNDQTSACQTGTCPASLATTTTIDNRALGDGEHTITVITLDGARNENRQEASIQVVNQSTLPARTLQLSSEPSTPLTGASASSTGASAAQVGDVDGDGVDDYLLGSPTQGGASTPGGAHLVFGSADTSALSLGAGARDSNGRLRSLQFTGAALLDRAGTSVAAAGDVNGDGSSDLLVGAPGTVTPVGGVASGKVHVVLGSAGLRTGAASRSLATLGAEGYTISGPTHTVADLSTLGLVKPVTFAADLGTRRLGDFAGDGDVNGDGLDDVVIGDSSTSTGTLGSNIGAGVTYVIFGKTDTAAIDLNATGGNPGTAGYRIYGATASGALGYSTAVAGDVNGDDRGDLLVTAPGEASTGGAAYLIFGRASGDVNTATLGSSGYRIAGSRPRAASATSTATRRPTCCWAAPGRSSSTARQRSETSAWRARSTVTGCSPPRTPPSTAKPSSPASATWTTTTFPTSRSASHEPQVAPERATSSTAVRPRAPSASPRWTVTREPRCAARPPAAPAAPQRAATTAPTARRRS